VSRTVSSQIDDRSQTH